MKLSFRLLTGFGLVSALLVTIIISANISIKKIQDDNKLVEQAHYIKCTFQDKYIDHIKWAQKIAQALLQSGNTALDIQTNPHLCDFGKWYYGEGRKQTEDLVPELKGVLDSIAQSHNTLHTSAIEIIASLEKNDKALALRQFSTNTMPALNIVGSQIMHINQSVTNHLQEINTRAEKDIRNQKIKIGIMGIIALTISILSGFLITKPVTRGISGAVKASKQLAEGNLNIEIEERFMNNKDEIGELTRAMHDTAQKLTVITESIRNGAEQVSMASKHVNSASYTISSAASQQAASVEQISSTIDQMTATIHQNTENAQTTEQVSALTASKINEMMSAASKSVESVRLITDKINIINDIAAQTNILALNAAVESANAGEMGRGFTVVAAEVRKLAERSKAAASEIMELSQQTLTMTETAGLLMHEMLPGIEKTAGMVKEISASSREQNTATSQINTAIQQLDHVTQENASASEELANSSTELAALAEQLINVINYFKN